MKSIKIKETAGWRRFFSFIYWKIQFMLFFNIGKSLNIISVFEGEIDDGD